MKQGAEAKSSAQSPSAAGTRAPGRYAQRPVKHKSGPLPQRTRLTSKLRAGPWLCHARRGAGTRLCPAQRPPRAGGNGGHETRAARRVPSSVIQTAATKLKSTRGCAFPPREDLLSSSTRRCQLTAAFTHADYQSTTSTTAATADTRRSTSPHVWLLCARSSRCLGAAAWPPCAAPSPLFDKQTRNKLLLSLRSNSHLSL